MALYGIFVLILLPLVPALVAVTIHPLLDVRDSLRHRRAERATRQTVIVVRAPAPHLIRTPAVRTAEA